MITTTVVAAVGMSAVGRIAAGIEIRVAAAGTEIGVAATVPMDIEITATRRGIVRLATAYGTRATIEKTTLGIAVTITRVLAVTLKSF
jgi:hypothetical protein